MNRSLRLILLLMVLAFLGMTILLTGVFATALPARRTAGDHAQNPSGQAGSKKKNPPPGARGFEQFAGRDAADKLIKGAATRRYAPAPSPGGLIRPTPQPVSERQAAIREGEKQYAAGNFEAAVAAYQKAIALSDNSASDNSDLQYALGKVYSDLERYEDAVAAFQAAATRRPASEVALYAAYQLGNAYLDLGKYAEAITAYEKTVKILSDEWKTSRPELSAQYLPYPHYSMGLAHLGLKQPERAVADFKKAIELKPDFPEAYFNLGLTLWQLGRAEAATAQQAKLKTLNPEMADKLAALFK